jgi:predicted RNA-binding Zn ribbon-like protein
MQKDRPHTRWTAADFVGGAVALDFANTAYGRWPGGIAERLFGYADLVSWSERAGTLAQGDARRLAAAARRQPGLAKRVLGQALALREALHRLLAALAAGKPPAPGDVARVQSWILRAQANAVLEFGAAGACWVWRASPVALERPLWPVARSASALLEAGGLDRLCYCPGRDCAWLFIDRSKNRARRWCSMATCGNRAKAERHYRRRTAAGALR